MDGEKYVLNKFGYLFASPEQDDIIVYNIEGIYYVARITGQPDEDGQYYVTADNPTEAKWPEKYIKSSDIVGKVIITH